MRRGRRGTRRAIAGLALGAAALGAVGAVALGRSQAAAPALVAWVRGARLVPGAEGVRQRRANDCGPAALAHALGRIGLTVRYPDPESPLRPGSKGCRLDEIEREARRLGAAARMRHVDPSEIDMIEPPAILHLSEGHFVVFEGRAAGGLRIQDPSLGSLEQSPRSLTRHWSGWALELDLPGRREP